MAETQGVLIVDGANWSHALEGGRLRIDYETLVVRIQQATGIKIIGLSYYTAYRTRADLDRRWGFFNYLKTLGWNVQAMPATLSADGQWRDKEVDVAIALDAYEEARSGAANAILIGSGDEDFAALFRRLPEDVQGWVVSFRNKTSPMLQQVANVLFIEDLGVVREAGPSMGSALYDPGTYHVDRPRKR